MAKDFAAVNRMELEAGLATVGNGKDELVSKFVKAWENQTARRALKGGTGISMALTLAACGGGSDDTSATAAAAPAATDDAAADATIPVLGDANSIIVGATTGQVTEGTDGNDVFIAAAVVSPLGVAQSSLTPLSTIDGGEGAADVLNIVAFDNGENQEIPATMTIQGIEIVNVIYAENPALLGASFADASNYDGVEQLWQVNFANNVIALGEATTAGFRDVDDNLSVTATATATSINVALEDVSDGSTLEMAGIAATTFNITGNLVPDVAANNVGSIALDINAADAATATDITLNSSVNVDVNVAFLEGNSANADTLDASGSTGDVFADGAFLAITTVTTGSGDDELTFDAAAGDLTVVTGAGADDVILGRMVTADDSIDMGADGAGNFFNGDTLSIEDTIDITNAAEAALFAGVTGVENLATNNTATIDGDLTAIRIFTAYAGGEVVVTDTVSGTTLNAVGAGGLLPNILDATFSGAAVGNSLNVNAIGFDDTGVDTVAEADVTVTGAGTLNIGSYGVADPITEQAFTSTNIIAVTTATTDVAVNVVGDADLDLDLSSMDVSGTGNGVTVAAGTLDGDLSIETTDGEDTIVTGAGDDIIDAGRGADDITIGAGSNTLIFAVGDSSEAAMDTVVGFNAVAATAEVDILTMTGVVAGDSVVTDVSGATTAALDVITAQVTDGVIALGGLDAANVDTLAEWINVAEILNDNGAATVVGFEFDGNTYVVESDGAAPAATTNVIELTGLTGVEALVDLPAAPGSLELTAAANTLLIA